MSHITIHRSLDCPSVRHNMTGELSVRSPPELGLCMNCKSMRSNRKVAKGWFGLNQGVCIGRRRIWLAWGGHAERDLLDSKHVKGQYTAEYQYLVFITTIRIVIVESKRHTILGCMTSHCIGNAGFGWPPNTLYCGATFPASFAAHRHAPSLPSSWAMI